jgi:exonuclease VII small subunit
MIPSLPLRVMTRRPRGLRSHPIHINQPQKGEPPMTKKELDAQANHLAEQQKKFVNTLYTLFDVVEGLENYLKSYSAMLETHTALLDAREQKFDSAMDLFKEAIKAIAEGNNAVNENTRKLDKFIAKMESYFGSGTGLEYDN